MSHADTHLTENTAVSLGCKPDSHPEYTQTPERSNLMNVALGSNGYDTRYTSSAYSLALVCKQPAEKRSRNHSVVGGMGY